LSTGRSTPRARQDDVPDRVRRLLDAQRAITADLPLPTLLDRIVSAACDLAHAQYGVLEVVGPDGTAQHFVHQAAITDSVADVGGHLAGPARALRVPIPIRETTFGELFLAEPAGDPFDVEDEDLVTALASTAGSAIETARLHAEASSTQDWLAASEEIARALLADADEAMLLEVVARTLEVARADYAGLILPTENGRLQVMTATGAGAEDFLGFEFDPGASPLGRAIAAGASMRTPDLMEWSRRDFANVHDFGPAMLAPLVDAHGSRGAVLVVRTTGRPPFTPVDVDQASAFAAQLALALQLNDARADAEWLQVLEERHRIAQDLHDNVIQRLFATGVGLEAMAEHDLAADTADRLRRRIAELDETIDEIRTRVFGPREHPDDELRHRRRRFPRVGLAGTSAAASGSTPGTPD
jgi:signal transduction histidine kinase